MNLLEALLDSWDRNNRITVNLLRALPDGVMDLAAAPGSPTIAQLFTHMHYVRLVFVEEDAPEFTRPMVGGEWDAEHNRAQLEAWLYESAQAVRDAVTSRFESGRAMERHYDTFTSRVFGGRKIEYLWFGRSGRPLVMFPTSGGRFHENEDRTLVGSLADYVDEGWSLRLAQVEWVIATGETDSLVNETKNFTHVLRTKGIQVHCEVWPGVFGHDWPFWKEHLRRFLP